MLAAILAFLTPFTTIFARFIRDKSAEKIAGEVTEQEKLRGEASVGVAKEETKQSEDDTAVGAQNAHVATENTVGKESTGGFFTNLNRVLRPLLTLVIIGLIAWFFIEPVSFSVWASKFAVLPDWLWALFSGIFAFWLGAPLAKFTKPAKVLTQAEAEAIVNPPVVVVPPEYKIEYREGDEPSIPPPTVAPPPAPQATTPTVKVVTKPKPVVKPTPKPPITKKPTKPVAPPPPKKPTKKTNLKSKFS